jgi:hypothetical protein
MPRSWLPVVALAVAVLPAAPSYAGVGVGGATWSASADARLCFGVRTTGITAGTATATGVVHAGETIPENPVTPVVLGLLPNIGIPYHLAIANTAVADARPLVSTSGYGSVCVGGIGAVADGGSVVFTLDAHRTTDDFVMVVECAYSASGPSCA